MGNVFVPNNKDITCEELYEAYSKLDLQEFNLIRLYFVKGKTDQKIIFTGLSNMLLSIRVFTVSLENNKILKMKKYKRQGTFYPEDIIEIDIYDIFKRIGIKQHESKIVEIFHPICYYTILTSRFDDYNKITRKLAELKEKEFKRMKNNILLYKSYLLLLCPFVEKKKIDITKENIQNLDILNSEFLYSEFLKSLI